MNSAWAAIKEIRFQIGDRAHASAKISLFFVRTAVPLLRYDFTPHPWMEVNFNL